VSDTQEAGAGSNEAGGQQVTTEGTQPPATSGEGGQQTQGETKPGDTKSADEIAFEFKAPEGVQLDQASLDEFSKIVKDKDLSPSERAQKLADLAVKREADRAQAFQETVKSWADTVAKDPELGKPENQAAARKVVEDFGTPELKDLLNSTGMGNHPEVVRFVLQVSKAMSEDTIVRARGNAAAGTQRPPAAVLYDNTPS
jgi:hypothetical protein